jgi:hypothetical protein
MERAFRTKTGTCTITDDQIIIARSGVRGSLSNAMIGQSISRALVLYGLLSLGCFATSYVSIRSGDFVTGAFTCLVGLWLARGVYASRHNTAVPIIERSTIRKIEPHAPRPPATRGYFVVHFEQGGNVRKRMIMLPGSLEGGQAEYAHAINVLREAGLITSEN